MFIDLVAHKLRTAPQSLMLSKEFKPEALLQALKRSQRYDVTNVEAHVLDTQTRVHGSKVTDIVPFCGPVAPSMWFEWRSNGEHVVRNVGVLITALDRRNDADTFWKQYSAPEDVRWMLVAQVFGEDHRGNVGGRPVLYGIYVREDGTPHNEAMYIGNDEESVQWERDHPGAFYFVVPLVALAFCHCKNVRQEVHRPSRQVMRKTTRDGEPAVEHRTLIIDSTHDVVRHEQTDGGSTGRQHRRHIVRGHFSEYSSERPLFGKYTGRVYVPMHARGTTKIGRVNKTYQVGKE